ncbi:MAG: hypothetical protein OXE99_01385 [Cellvibrionales bacterium]|nr:hypothetical protein [Cellvibrionales bacterium]
MPGDKRVSPDGFTVEADEHGLFHLSNAWMLDRKKRHVVITLDADSLPSGMKVVSEKQRFCLLPLTD